MLTHQGCANIHQDICEQKRHIWCLSYYFDVLVDCCDVKSRRWLFLATFRVDSRVTSLAGWLRNMSLFPPQNRLTSNLLWKSRCSHCTQVPPYPRTPDCRVNMWTLTLTLCVSEVGSVRLVSISCGSQNVWALDSRGLVYFRVGTQPLNPNMMLPAWIHIEPPEQVTYIPTLLTGTRGHASRTTWADSTDVESLGQRTHIQYHLTTQVTPI